MQELAHNLEEAQNTSESINAEEILFGMPPMRFPQIQQMTSQFEPFLKLWSIADGFKKSEEEWMVSNFSSLDVEKIEGEVRYPSGSTSHCVRWFRQAKTQGFSCPELDV